MVQFNPHSYMDPNPVVRYWNNELYLFEPTNVADMGWGSVGIGGTVRKLTPEENPNGIYNHNNTFNATIDPTTWVQKGMPSDDEIFNQVQTTFSGMDPNNISGWQNYLNQNKAQIVQTAKSYLLANPGDNLKMGGNVWNEFRNNPANAAAIQKTQQSQAPATRPEFTSENQAMDYSGRMQAWHDDYAIVASSDNPSQLYWVDNKNKIAQPFQSANAAAAFMTKATGQTYTPADIQAATTTVGYDFFSIGGIALQSGTAALITNDGNNPITQTNPPASGASTTPSTYGATPTEQSNTSGWQMMMGLLNVFSKAGISTGTIDKIKNDPNEMTLMMSALSYGGYAPADIFRELKRYEGAAAGDTSLAGMVVIDPNKTAVDFKKTPGYSATVNDARLRVPQKIADIDSSVLELPVYQLPDEVFTNLKQGYDIQSPEFQAEMDKVKTLIYDAQDQLLSAQTQQDYQVAQANYKQLQSDVAESYGIQLSNNAFDAFNQINTVGKSASSVGLYGSGIMDEAIDRTLSATRKNDQLQRNAQLKEEDKNKANYYQSKATAAEISGLTPEERLKYGLTPSQEAINFYSIENLRKQYPDTPDSILQQYANSVIDTSTGTPLYRSTLWSTMYANKLGNTQSKTSYQQENVQDKYKLANERAMRQYDVSDPFSGKLLAGEKPYVPPAKPQTNNAAAADAAQAIKTGNGLTPVSSTPTPYSKEIDAAARAADTFQSSTPAVKTTTRLNPITGLLEKVPVV